jgi:hypothetical protein
MTSWIRHSHDFDAHPLNHNATFLMLVLTLVGRRFGHTQPLWYDFPQRKTNQGLVSALEQLECLNNVHQIVCNVAMIEMHDWSVAEARNDP